MPIQLRAALRLFFPVCASFCGSSLTPCEAQHSIAGLSMHQGKGACTKCREREEDGPLH